MRIIILETKAYKISEKHFEALTNKQEQLNSEPDRHGKDVEMDDFINALKPLFKCLGYVDFDFRL